MAQKKLGKNVEPTQKPVRPRPVLTCYAGQINSPGCYIVNHMGTLLRVPEEALVPGQSPTIDGLLDEKWIVTKIADDPFLQLTRARMSAADLDLDVNF